jgi:tRNA pseudouridine38-40 synthase
VLHASWRRDGDEVVFRIEADSFLRHMVRILVGTMLAVAGGRFELAAFEELLSGADRTAAGETAPPHALCLVAVRY